MHNLLTLVLTLTLPTIILAQTPAPDFTCPESDIAESDCMGPKDCTYPNPSSCTTFIRCTVNEDGKTGTAYVYDCPESLEWNDDKECDMAGEGDCERDL